MGVPPENCRKDLALAAAYIDERAYLGGEILCRRRTPAGEDCHRRQRLTEQDSRLRMLVEVVEARHPMYQA